MYKISLFFSSVLIILLSIILQYCGTPVDTQQTSMHRDTLDVEAHEDSLEYALAVQLQGKIRSTVTGRHETPPIGAGDMEDAADDPAIWINPDEPAKSVIFGSNKKGGINSYTLHGEEIDYFPIGNINNIDIISGVSGVDGSSFDLLGGTNRSQQNVSLFVASREGNLIVAETKNNIDNKNIDDIYGFCFYKSPIDDMSYLFINAKNGYLSQYAIHHLKDHLFNLEQVRSYQFASQVEGMVADNLYGHLFVGEEDKGVWKMEAEPHIKPRPEFIPGSGEENPNIVYDVEGLTLYTSDTGGYLIVSSQGNFSYAVFERDPPHEYLGSFKIVSSGEIDGVEETDGIQATSAHLNADYPEGIFIAQDGFNYEGEIKKSQNFKYIDWREIRKTIESF